MSRLMPPPIPTASRHQSATPFSADTPPGIAGSVLNCLTVDVEDYFHCEVFADLLSPGQWLQCADRLWITVPPLLDLFAEFDTSVTFFVLGWVAARHPQLVRRIAEAGHEIASHGYGHQHLSRMTPETFASDLRDGRSAIQDATGRDVLGYRAPTFSITRRTAWAADVLCQEGFTYDSSIFPIRHDRYGVPGAPAGPFWLTTPAGRILELPPLTLRVAGAKLPAAGGGYLRLMPVQWARMAIHQANAHSRPAVMYFHPWELDTEQPRLPLSRLQRFRHTVGIKRMASKLRRLLDGHRFCRMDELARQQDRACRTQFALQ